MIQLIPFDMKKMHKKILRHVWDLLLITLISFGIALFFSRSQNITWSWAGYAMLYSFLIGGSLWKGNEFFGWLAGKKFPEKKNPALSLRVQVFILISFSIADIFLVNYIWFSLIWNNNFSDFLLNDNGWVILLIQFIVAVVIGLIFYVAEFFKAWKYSLKQEEIYKREKLSLQYETLKNQVNPHFLFNSLNTLSALIYTDQDKADRFVRKLSGVYRYILEQKDKELVSLQSEMEFVRQFIDLQQIRFGDALKVNIRLTEDNNYRVIPISLQMLVENAIKHNVVTDENPLQIDIYTDADNYLVVKNNLQKKRFIKPQDEKKPGWVQIGLANIKSRYEYLTNKEFMVNDPEKGIVIEDDTTHFIVKLPLVNNEQEE